MSTPVFHRRRAARLAVLLDEAARGRRHHRRTDVDGELGDLVRLAGRVGQRHAAPDPGPGVPRQPSGHAHGQDRA